MQAAFGLDQIRDIPVRTHHPDRRAPAIMENRRRGAHRTCCAVRAFDPEDRIELGFTLDRAVKEFTGLLDILRVHHARPQRRRRPNRAGIRPVDPVHRVVPDQRPVPQIAVPEPDPRVIRGDPQHGHHVVRLATTQPE